MGLKQLVWKGWVCGSPVLGVGSFTGDGGGGWERDEVPASSSAPGEVLQQTLPLWTCSEVKYLSLPYATGVFLTAPSMLYLQRLFVCCLFKDRNLASYHPLGSPRTNPSDI